MEDILIRVIIGVIIACAIMGFYTIPVAAILESCIIALVFLVIIACLAIMTILFK